MYFLTNGFIFWARIVGDGARTHELQNDPVDELFLEGPRPEHARSAVCGQATV